MRPVQKTKPAPGPHARTREEPGDPRGRTDIPSTKGQEQTTDEWVDGGPRSHAERLLGAGTATRKNVELGSLDSSRVLATASSNPMESLISIREMSRIDRNSSGPRSANFVLELAEVKEEIQRVREAAAVPSATGGSPARQSHYEERLSRLAEIEAFVQMKGGRVEYAAKDFLSRFGDLPLAARSLAIEIGLAYDKLEVGLTAADLDRHLADRRAELLEAGATEPQAELLLRDVAPDYKQLWLRILGVGVPSPLVPDTGADS